MTFEEKIEIIREKGIDFLGFDEVDKIIAKIENNPKLIKDMLKAPDSFWETAEEKGLLVYSDSTEKIYSDEPDEIIVTKYIDPHPKQHMPTLVYEKRMKKSKIR